MSIVTNGTTIPENGDNIIYDGIAVTKVVCNGTTVWEKALGVVNALTIDSSSYADIGYDTVDEVYGDLVPATMLSSTTTYTVTSLFAQDFNDLIILRVDENLPSDQKVLLTWDGGTALFPVSTSYSTSVNSASFKSYMNDNFFATVDVTLEFVPA